MGKINLVYLIATIIILSQGCNHPLASNHQYSPDMLCTAAETTSERIYDCAANSLYALCRKSNIPIQYEECLELLPFTSKGNSMLEFKAALLCLDFQVEAQMLTIEELANIRVPATLLMPDTENMAQPYGHYLILWPLADGEIQILDYPREPIVLSTEHWIRHLKTAGIKKIPVLLCGKPSQSLEDMLS